MTTNQAELVFILTPIMGHLLSAMKVAKLIIQHNQHISILIVIPNLPMNISKVNSYIDSQLRSNTYSNTRLTFVTLPPLSRPPDPASPNYLKAFIELQKPLVKQTIVAWTKAGLHWPVGFIVDMLCTSMMDIANELDIPPYIFFPSGASFLNMMFHFQSLADVEGVDIATEFSDPNKIFDVPGIKNQVTGKVVPQIFLEKEGGCSMMLEHTRRFRQAKGILLNSFLELETYGVQALFDQVDKGDIPAVYPVGPILELDDEHLPGFEAKEEQARSILEWLDDQPESSVVFSCFGSMGSFKEDQVKEIAEGLESSGHRFLWSLQKPPSGEGKHGLPSEHETFVESLPEGFLDRTADRGTITGWAPQVSILSHPAIGGFVSHCGWNSTLESMWFGVPMATWPVYAEQQLNAFMLVKELELAVEIRMDYRYVWKTKNSNFLVTAQEIENGVRKLMNLNEETKCRVREMKDRGRKALENGGSSYNWLTRFVEDVLSKVA